MESIQLRNISKSYGDKVVLNDISFSVQTSETVVLLGPSGCGKTTLLKLINRLIEPDSGQILIDGNDTGSTESHLLKRSIGYVIQDVGLLPHLSIEKNIGIVKTISGRNLSNDRLLELITLTGLSGDLLSRFPSELSGGQQQRVGITRALANDAPLILMDEPFSALDNITRNQLQDDFLHLKALDDKTIVMVTHDIPEAFKLADRIVLLNEGVVQQIGTPEELLFKPENEFVTSFLEKDELLLRIQSSKKGQRDLVKFLKDESITPEAKALALTGIFKKGS